MKNIFALFLLLAGHSYAQLGFCTGSKGDPIFFEDFGSGTNFGPALPAGFTSYTYVPGVPGDGQYTIHYMNAFNGSWHNAPDHTPDNVPDGLNGKALIVNASFVAGEFYKRTVSGLCVNTTFEFSAWVMNVYDTSSNVCSGTGIPIDVTFEIWDGTETTLLQSGSTSPIQGTSNAVWTQYALTFTTLPGQTDVVLKMKNNGAGGCGNDLAIDDITFRSCGDPATITTPMITGNRYDVCEDAVPVNLPLNIVISNATPHVFQWQESLDGNVWTDIAGANASTYNITNLIVTKLFRVKIAQDASNLANPFCFTVSDSFSVNVIPKPAAPVSNGDVIACSATIPALTVQVTGGNSVDWFDAPIGGNLVQANSNSYAATVSGTYYAETFIPNLTCRSATRTAVNIAISQTPAVSDETTVLCQNDTKMIDAGIPNLSYNWSTGETTQTITIASGGIYTVVVTNGACSATKTVTVQQDLEPILVSISIDEETATVNSSTPNLEYSIDGINYQDSPVFSNLSGGLHTIYIRKKNGCPDDMISENILILAVPKFFTPNGDGFNDVLEVPELGLFPNAKMTIYDRYGKLLKMITAAKPQWDGTFNGKKLPATDYWYKVSDDSGELRKGHFTLKR